MDEVVPDFTGKVVAVYFWAGTLPLEAARFERVAGKEYLVGRQVSDPADPHFADRTVHYVARDQVTYFAVFESVESYLAALTPPAPEPAPPSRRSWLDWWK